MNGCGLAVNNACIPLFALASGAFLPLPAGSFDGCSFLDINDMKNESFDVAGTCGLSFRSGINPGGGFGALIELFFSIGSLKNLENPGGG